jgi:hypothetical protein
MIDPDRLFQARRSTFSGMSATVSARGGSFNRSKIHPLTFARLSDLEAGLEAYRLGR